MAVWFEDPKSLRCLLPRWTRRIKVQLRRTVCRLMFAVRVRAEWKPTEIIGFFTQLCATLIQWTNWNSTKIKLLIIPLKTMLNTCTLNRLIKWSSPICIFAQFWHCFIEANFAPLILADLYFPTIKPQSMLTKSFREIEIIGWYQTRKWRRYRHFVSNFFWCSVAVYYPK